eukprot:m.246181 g.246181  ORF g.246181 m.246181 type:complete len:140 (+) comp10962_c0_seq1:1506-1925(+)
MADLSELIAWARPQLVQFSGHGTRRELQFATDELQFQSVSVDDVVPILMGRVCVVLHCCHGKVTAEVLFEHGVPFVVFYDGRLPDRTASLFSERFYGLLFNGHGVRASFAAAKHAAGDDNCGLLARDGVDDLKLDVSSC